MGLALAGPLILSIVQLSGADWAKPFRRVPEAMGAALPAALVLGVVLVRARTRCTSGPHAESVEPDALLQHKSGWLNLLGFSVRMLVYFAVWIWLARKLSGRLRSQDPEPRRTHRDTALSAGFMAAFAVTFSLASIDWVQSLDPHWFSTIFALRTLSGLGISGVAVCTIILVVLRRRGPLRDVVSRTLRRPRQDPARADRVLAYSWYCQYMIIWYSNLPEETGYYLLRREHGWGSLVPVNLAVTSPSRSCSSCCAPSAATASCCCASPPGSWSATRSTST